jgi:hypothetical protein
MERERAEKAKENDKGSPVEELGRTRWRTKGGGEEMAGKGSREKAREMEERWREREREWEREREREG